MKINVPHGGLAYKLADELKEVPLEEKVLLVAPDTFNAIASAVQPRAWGAREYYVAPQRLVNDDGMRMSQKIRDLLDAHTEERVTCSAISDAASRVESSKILFIANKSQSTSKVRSDLDELGFKNYEIVKLSREQLSKIKSCDDWLPLMDELKKKHNAEAITLDCFGYTTRDAKLPVPCIALAKSDIPFACEADPRALYGKMLAQELGYEASFMSNITDADGDSIRINHCLVPLKMVDDFTIDDHFESKEVISGREHNARGSVQANFKTGKVASAFSYDPLRKVLLVGVGRIVESKKWEHNCISGARIKLESVCEIDLLNGQMRDFSLSKDDLGLTYLNLTHGAHQIMVYGDVISQLEVKNGKR